MSIWDERQRKHLSKVFSEKLKEWEKSTGGTQQDFADKTGYSLNMITKLKRGEALPNAHHLNMICSELGIDPEILATRVSRPKAHWIEGTPLCVHYVCSACGERIFRNTTRYCPNCGAEMFEDEQDVRA